MSMQQANDERYATMHNLLQQTSESVAKVAAEVDSMQKAAQDQQGTQGNSLQQLSGQMQSMNDSLDELRARLDKIDKNLNHIRSQQQSLTAGQACSGRNPPTGPADNRDRAGAIPPPGQTRRRAHPRLSRRPRRRRRSISSISPPPAITTPQNTIWRARSSAMSSSSIRRARGRQRAVLSGRNRLPRWELQERHRKLSQVLAAISRQFQSSHSALRKGESELALGQRDSGIHDLRSLIQRHPQTPEAMQARSKLNGWGSHLCQAFRGPP